MIKICRNESNLRRIPTEGKTLSYKGYVFPDGDNVIDLKGNGVVVYDAEIYNVPEKHKTLRGYLRKLFSEENIQSITRKANFWDGAWAIVYINPNGTLYAFTDPLGIKQLYFNTLGEVCSLCMPIVDDFTKIDFQYRSSVYKWGYNTDDRTPWEKVKRVLPNYLYSFAGGRVLHKEFYPYFMWDSFVPTETLDEVFKKALSRRLQYHGKDAKLLLSGGLDSSIVASVSAELGTLPSLVTIANQGELEYAELVAEYLKAPLQKEKYEMDEISVLNALLANESPVDLGSMVPQNCMMALLRGNTIFTGDGADELFGGYRRAKEYDSQLSDVFEELIFYHLPRIQKMAQKYNVTVCAPFLSQDVVRKALSLSRAERIDKIILKNSFRDILPLQVLTREKKALKNPKLVEDGVRYKKELFHHFYDEIIPDMQSAYINKRNDQ